MSNTMPWLEQWQLWFSPPPWFSNREMTLESCFVFLSPWDSLAFISNSEACFWLILPVLFSPPQSHWYIPSCLREARACSQDPRWHRMLRWHSLLSFCHAATLAHSFGNCALWFIRTEQTTRIMVYWTLLTQWGIDSYERVPRSFRSYDNHLQTSLATNNSNF